MAAGFMVGSIVGKFLLDITGWSKSIESVAKDKKKVAGMSDELSKKIRGVGTSMTVVGGILVAGFGMAAKAAANAAETTSKFGVVFGPVMDDANKALETLANSYGLSRDKAREMLSGTGDLLTGLGMTAEAGLDLSEKVQQLAVDLASFQNYSGGAEGASAALTKGLLGEREMLKSLGIVINEEMLKTELMARGKEKLTGLALMQEKAYITLELATRQSKNALGDFGRTQDSIVNQTRILNARLDDLRVEVGTALLPVLTALVRSVVPIVQDIMKWAQENPKLTATLVKVAAAFGAFNLVLGPVVMGLPGMVKHFLWLKVNSPAVAAGIAGVGSAFATVAGGVGLGYAAYKLLILARDEYEKATGTYVEEEIKNWALLNENLGGASTAFVTLSARLRAMGVDTWKASEMVDKIREDFSKSGKASEIYGKILEGVYGPQIQKAFRDIIGLTDEQMQKMGFLKKATKDASSATATFNEELENLLGSTSNATDAFAEFGVTTKTKLQAELVRAEAALTKLRNSNERTVGGVRILEDKIKDLRAQIYGTRTVIETKINATSRWATQLQYAAQTIKGQTIPASRDLIGVLGQAPDKMKSYEYGVKQAVDATGAGVTTMRQGWEGLFTDISQKWGQTIKTWVEGDLTFKKFREELWEDMKDTFFTMVGKMATEWTVGFIEVIAKSLLGLEAPATGVAGVISTVFTTAFTAVLTSVMAVAGFIYAFFNWLSNKATEGSGDYWGDQDRRPDKGGGSRRPGTGRPGGGGYGDRDTLSGFADGGIAWEKQVAMVAEKGPEIIMPLSDYRAAMAAAGGISIPVTVNVNGTMITDREYVGTRLIREITDALGSAPVQRNFQRALGIAGVGA